MRKTILDLCITGEKGGEVGRKTRDIIKKRMTPARIAEARKLAKE